MEEVSVLGSCFLNETWVYFLIAFVMRGEALHGVFPQFYDFDYF